MCLFGGGGNISILAVDDWVAVFIYSNPIAVFEKIRMNDSTARKEARDRWNKQNPSSTVRLPRYEYELLLKIARDRKTTQHGLLKQIVMEWLEKNAN